MARGRRAIPKYRSDFNIGNMVTVSDGNMTQPSQSDVEPLARDNFGIGRNFVDPPLYFSPVHNQTYNLSSTIRSSIDRLSEIE